MRKPTLVIMAAGLGSRFGGCKQITPIDEAGHIIIDYSIYDAIRAGFGKVVCVIKPEMEADFRAAFGDRIARFVDLDYAYQTIDRLPDGFTVPEGRTRPWGTAHAVLCAADAIEGDFAAINADDFYGATAFQTACDYLSAPRAGNEHAMIGYRIENTLTENGSVSRGICDVDEHGILRRITERLRIEPRPGGAAYLEEGVDEVFVPAGTMVSMNLWAFRHDILDEIRARFVDFLCDKLPAERWYGVTYPQDLTAVQAAMAGMRERGVYPAEFWR